MNKFSTQPTETHKLFTPKRAHLTCLQRCLFLAIGLSSAIETAHQ